MRRQKLSRSHQSGEHIALPGFGASVLCLMLGLSLHLVGCSSDDDDTQDPSTMMDGGDGNGDEDSEDGGTQPSPDASTDDASTDDEEDTTPSEVEIEDGPIVGEILDENGEEIHVFRGVPYAAPTGGENRWKPPQPVEPWTEPREATEWGDRCPQDDSRLTANGEISEDCLNLNVLTPSLDEEAELPVMVFFHGGGLTIGTANSPTYSHTALPAQGVVVVTVNQRLGPFGYFAHPALAEESEHDASGNYGVLDQIAALEWVQANAATFGGDAGNVTIFGESGGGTKVLSAMGSPLAEELFHRAIVQSGSRVVVEGAVTPREEAEEMGTMVASELEIGAEDEDALEQLRERSWEEILEASASDNVSFVANLAIDGWVFPQSIHDAFANGDQADVPLIVGANEGEASLLTMSVPELAAAMESVSSDAYVYLFSYVPPGWQADDCFAFHGLELAYVFGHMPGLETPTMRFLGMSAGCPTDLDPDPSEVDEQVAENTMRIWSRFAETGDPSVPDLIDWPAYTPDEEEYLEIGSELEVKTGVSTAGEAAPGIGGTEE